MREPAKTSMTPKQWEAVERSFHEALSRPPEEWDAFLLRAYPDDEVLRREVRSLLDQSVSADGILKTASIKAPLIPIGTPIGQYRIERHIASGGMGVVFAARDTKLGRSVAIKFLSNE